MVQELSEQQEIQAIRSEDQVMVGMVGVNEQLASQYVQAMD